MIGFLLVLLYFGLALLAAVIILQPDRFSVSRARVVDAPPGTVFRHINELRQWEEWSPWFKLDPNARNTYDGPPSGPGASFAWSGGNKVGAGRMTVVESRPFESVQIKLDMQKPFAGSNDVFFRLTPEGAGTRVVWTMTGRNKLISKAMNLVMNFDKRVGSRFEEGLANLNAVVAKG